MNEQNQEEVEESSEKTTEDVGLVKDPDKLLEKEKQGKKEGSRKAVTIVIALLIILTAGLFLGNKYIQQQQLITEILNTQKEKNLQTSDQIKELEKKIKRQQNQQQNNSVSKKQITDLSSRVISMQAQLNLTQQKLLEKKGGVDLDLLLSEADFLIRIAAIRLMLTEDAKATISLLEAADKRLLRMNDVAILPVREAIATDLYKLKVSQQVDITGTYLRLEVLGKELKKLKTNFILPKKQQQQKSNNKNTEGWKEHIAESSEKVLNKWFQVTSYSKDVKPLMSPNQVSLLKQGINLKIKQAQWAFIQKEIDLYQIVLKGLQDEIENYFNTKDIKTAQQEIKKLILESKVAPLPKTLTAEKSIKNYIQQKLTIGKK